MSKQCVFIAGSGGIGSAVGLLLRHFWDRDVDLILGDINEASSAAAKQWILRGGAKKGQISTCQMVGGWEANLSGCTLLLDCLPGSLAPAMARLAIRYGLHYVNLTEYVAETKEIVGFTENASTGFALQSGLAPGFVNVLGHKLFQQFCQAYGVETAESLEMRVGALTKNAMAPHFYGFTWSPIGVATEYVKQAEVVRDNKLIYVDALSGRRSLLINGRPYEEDLTSGGAADIPIRFADKIKNIDYKTLRYPGHYGWVDTILSNDLKGQAKIDALEKTMLNTIPSMEDDEVIIYCAVEGKDSKGQLRRIDADIRVLPMTIGEVTLRAIQSTTAAGMAEAARIIVEQDHQGVLFQSQIDPDAFLNGPFVRRVYYGSGV